MKSTTTSKVKQFTIFDFLKAIIDLKPDWDKFTVEQKKTFNNFMIHKFLSMNPKYIEIVNYIQKLNIQDSKKLYEVYCFMIPQSKNTYSPFVKSNVKKMSSPEALQHVSEYFKCSTSEASEYIQLTDEKWLENILLSKGVDEKQVKKLIKNG
jgi:hypothetical protein